MTLRILALPHVLPQLDRGFPVHVAIDHGLDQLIRQRIDHHVRHIVHAFVDGALQIFGDGGVRRDACAALMCRRHDGLDLLGA